MHGETTKECLRRPYLGTAQAFMLFYDQPDGDQHMEKQNNRNAHGEL